MTVTSVRGDSSSEHGGTKRGHDGSDADQAPSGQPPIRAGRSACGPILGFLPLTFGNQFVQRHGVLESVVHLIGRTYRCLGGRGLVGREVRPARCAVLESHRACAEDHPDDQARQANNDKRGSNDPGRRHLKIVGRESGIDDVSDLDAEGVAFMRGFLYSAVPSLVFWAALAVAVWWVAS